MTKDEIVSKLESMGLDRVWLASQIHYTYDTTRNSLAEKAPEPSERFRDACERALLEQERRRNVDLTRPDASVWDLVYFSGVEIRKIDQAQTTAGYAKKEDLYHDAVIDYCERLIEQASNEAEEIPAIPEAPKKNGKSA